MTGREIDPDEWMETPDGWFNAETRRLFTSPSGDPVAVPEPIKVTSDMIGRMRGIGPRGATLEPATDGRGGPPEARSLIGTREPTHFDPETGAFLDADGAVVGYHDSVASAISAPFRLPDGRVLIRDGANDRFLDADGNIAAVDRDFEPLVSEDLHSQGMRLDQLDERSALLAMLASGNEDVASPVEGRLHDVLDGLERDFDPAAVDPDVRAMVRHALEHPDRYVIDVESGQITSVDPRAQGKPEPSADPVQPPEAIDVAEWVQHDREHWIHLPSQRVYEHPGGSVLEGRPMPERIRVDESLFHQARALTPDGITQEPPTGFRLPSLTDPTGEVPAWFDPATRAYLDEDGEIIGFHESIAADIGRPVTFPDGRTIIVDTHNERYLDATGNVVFQKLGSDSGEFGTEFGLAGMSRDQIEQMLLSAGTEGIELQGDGVVVVDEALSAVIDEIVEDGPRSLVTLDVVDGSLSAVYPTVTGELERQLPTALDPERADARWPDDTNGSGLDADEELRDQEFDLDDWMEVGPAGGTAWIHVPSGQLRTSPLGGERLSSTAARRLAEDPDDPGSGGPFLITVRPGMLEDFRGLSDTGLIEPVRQGEEWVPRTGIVDAGPPVSFEPRTGAYLDVEGNVVGYHASVAEQVGRPIPVGDRVLIWDSHNQRFLERDGVVVADLSGELEAADDVELFAGIRYELVANPDFHVSFDGLDREEIEQLLLQSGAGGIEPDERFSGSDHITGAPIPIGRVDPSMEALIDEIVDTPPPRPYRLDLLTGSITDQGGAPTADDIDAALERFERSGHTEPVVDEDVTEDADAEAELGDDPMDLFPSTEPTPTADSLPDPPGDRPDNDASPSTDGDDPSMGASGAGQEGMPAPGAPETQGFPGHTGPDNPDPPAPAPPDESAVPAAAGSPGSPAPASPDEPASPPDLTAPPNDADVDDFDFIPADERGDVRLPGLVVGEDVDPLPPEDADGVVD